MKKFFNVWLKPAVVILVAGVIFLIMAAGIFLVSTIMKTEEPIQVRTDIEPIYNHFPDLPETSQIQWCSKSSDGIGLTTTYLYIFAFYDNDISNELQDMVIKDNNEEIEVYFVPDGVDANQKWKHVEDAGFAFQKDIKNTQKMWTTVSINEAGTILYIEAVGD